MIFKAADGTTIDEVLGNGYKTKTKEIELEEDQIILGFYGSINNIGQALQSIGLITYNTKHCLMD